MATDSLPASWSPETRKAFQGMRTIFDAEAARDTPTLHPQTREPPTREAWPAGVELQLAAESIPALKDEKKLGAELKRAAETEPDAAYPLSAWWIWPEGKVGNLENGCWIGLNGGGNIGGSPIDQLHLPVYAGMVRQSGLPLFAPVYRVVTNSASPFRPFRDVLASYLWLLEKHAGTLDASKIRVRGDSAGGGHAISLAYHALTHDLPLPGKLLLMFPSLSTLPDTEHTPAHLRATDNPGDIFPLAMLTKGNNLWVGKRGEGESDRVRQSPYINKFNIPTDILARLPPALLPIGSLDNSVPSARAFADKVIAAQRQQGRADREVFELDVVPDVTHAWPQLAHIFPEQAEQSLNRVVEFGLA